MSQHLVIGARGLVGSHLVESLARSGREAILADSEPTGPGMRELDIRDRSGVALLVSELRPSVIYLPAAISNVDYCEQHPDVSYRTNVMGTANVLDAANAHKAKLVFFSSDYIFDGESGPYSENSPPNPLNEYGKQKVYAENIVGLQARDFLIVRTTIVFGKEARGKNFIYRLLKALSQGVSLSVPTDQIGTPTYAVNLADAVVELATTGRSGVFNVAGPEAASRYEFACYAADAFGLDKRQIKPALTSALMQPAKRPLRLGLKSDKVSLGLTTQLAGFREALSLVRAQIEETLSVGVGGWNVAGHGQ